MIGVDPLAWAPAELAREYRFERILGEEQGIVRVLAHDRRLDRPVLLVLLSTAHGGDRLPVEPFLAGMRLLARVGHAGVRAVQRADAYGHVAFAVLEHVEGEPLADHLARGRRPLSEAAGHGIELLDALEASHARGVAHPELSAATVVRDYARLVIDGVGAVPADPTTQRAGLEAVARIVYHAATGRPWDAAADQPFTRVPRALRSVLRRALAADPDTRWPDAASFGGALAAARRPSWTVGAAVALLGVFVAASAGWLPLPPWRPSAPPSNELAVLPLDGADSLGPALAHLLTLELKDVPGLDLTSSKRIERWSARHGGQLEGVQHLAPRELGVRWAVHGLVTRTPGHLHVRLTLYPWRGTKVSLPEVSGSEQDLTGLSERLSLPMLAVVAPELEPRVGELEDLVGVPFDAVKAFLQGEAAFDRDAWTQARRYYEGAIATDPGFALARWRLANVKRWEREPYDFFGDIRKLDEQYGDRLRASDRAVVEALLTPDLDRRLAQLDSLASRPRSDAYLQYLYAEELFHRGPLAGHDIELAVRAMGRTIERDSSFAEAYNHLFAAHLRAGRSGAARHILGLRRRIAAGAWPGDLDKVRLMELAYDARFHPLRARLKLWALDHTHDSSTLAGVAQVARLGDPWFDIPGAQVALCRILLDHAAATDSARAGARNGIALGLMTLGRPTAALAQLDSAVALAPSAEARLQRAEWNVFPHLAGLPTRPAAGSSWRDALQRLRADPAGPAFAPRIQWALAAGSLGAGDTAGFVAHADTLEALAPGSPLAALLRAVGAGARGQPGLALAISDSLRAAMSVNQPPDPFAGAVYHLLRADWHLAASDHRAADRDWRWIDGSDFNGWPIGVVQAGEIDAAFGVYARWRRGDAALESATTAVDSAAACARLRRVVELWSGSEPVMRPLREAAVQRVRACRR